MEYLDIYDENENYLGKELRNVVHEKALWHKTVHCWLYNSEGNIYFQIRKDDGKYYTTASGHVSAGESVKEAFGREIIEEIGIELNYESAEVIEIVKFTLDRENKDKSFFRDRAFANVYGYLYNEKNYNFDMNPSEVTGLIKVNAKDTLDLFNKNIDSIKATIINLNNETEEKEININDFLINQGETALLKYGNILNFVISKTQN